KVIETSARGGQNDLPVQSETVVPAHARLDKMPIGQRLHAGARTVIIVPADVAYKLFAITIPPQTELVGLDRVDAKLHRVAAAAPFGPGIAEQAIGEQPKMDRPRIAKRDVHAFGAEPRFTQAD